MVRRRRKIIWSGKAAKKRKEIFIYWNNRNKSKTYSKKLNMLFTEALRIVASFPESSTSSQINDLKLKLVRDYYLVYQITESSITVLTIWDTRQNPENFPLT